MDKMFSASPLPDLARLSPFEIKDELIHIAKDRTQNKAATLEFLNAGRGNPNWTATTPRDAFFLLGQFAVSECKRDWDEPDLGGMPNSWRIADRLKSSLAASARNPGASLLLRTVDYGVETLGFEPDAFVHEMVDAVVGDNYPVPGRMLTHCERIVHEFLVKEMCGGRAMSKKFDLFAVEGGTAAMCYVFNSLSINGLLKPGDSIAIGTPILTPYIEMTQLSGFKMVPVEQSSMEMGLHTWRYPESELRKLEDPKVKAFFVVNPSNPASVAIDPAARKRIVSIVKNKRPDLIILTDDAYGTFVDGFRSLAAELPRNTILAYSFSKHFGCTGWRLGLVAVHKNNIFDEALAKAPAAKRTALERRYGSLTTEPHKLKFIDRMVADSRNIALNHTAGLSPPQQVQMTLFALFDLLDEEDQYKARCKRIVRERLQALVDGLGLTLPAVSQRASYYAVLDLEAWARRTHGDAFMAWAAANHVPLDIVIGLARNFGTAVLNGDGFGGPPWSMRVSLANLPTDAYWKIGKYIAEGTLAAVKRWQADKVSSRAKAETTAGSRR